MAKIKKREMNMVKVKSRSRNISFDQASIFKNHGISNIALGAAAGCVIGVAAALFLTPKDRRHKFTQGLDSIYNSITDVADEYTHKVMDKGQKAYQTAKDSAEDLYSATSQIFTGTAKHSNRYLLLGILGAGLLGASTVYALSQTVMPEAHTFANRWKTSKWSDMAKLIVDTVSNKLHEGEEALSEVEHHHPIQNVLDWATTGFNIWQTIKKGR